MRWYSVRLPTTLRCIRVRFVQSASFDPAPMQWCQTEFQAEPGPQQLTILYGTIYLPWTTLGTANRMRMISQTIANMKGANFGGNLKRSTSTCNVCNANSLSPISHIAVIFCIDATPSYYDMNTLRGCLQTCLEIYLGARSPMSPICFRGPRNDKRWTSSENQRGNTSNGAQSTLVNALMHYPLDV